MQMTTVVCHECQSLTEFHSVEWPPKLFICFECQSFFKLNGISISGEPIFHLAGYCRIK